MAYISKDAWKRKQKSSGKEHKTVQCQYSIGKKDDGTPFLEIATRNPDSIKGGISQIIRIPKDELLFFVAEMFEEGMLRFADLDKYLSVKKSNS